MRYLFLFIALLFHLPKVASQQDLAELPEEWRGLVRAQVGKGKGLMGEQVCLVYGLDNSYPASKVLRRLGRGWVIAQGCPPEAIECWLLDDRWKFNAVSDDLDGGVYRVLAFSEVAIWESPGVKMLKKFSDRNVYWLQVDSRADLYHLLANPEVLYVDDKRPHPELESQVLDMNLNPNRVNKIHHYFPQLQGASEVVAIKENRHDSLDIDLLGRTIVGGLESEDQDSHATEMATIIAGAGNSYITGKGVASGAQILSSAFGDVMPDADQYYRSYGVQTQNHSYGTTLQAEYGLEAYAFDQSAFVNPDLLHVFSCGNSGEETSQEGMYAGVEGFANLTGTIKMTKNSLVVGAVDTVGSALDFVSRGPAYDGRIKPEVCSYSVYGSSNAAALVSGVSVLLQQQYRELFDEPMPSALLKALLINSAEDAGAVGLDYVTGFGSVNAYKSLLSLRNQQFFAGEVSSGQSEAFTLDLPDNALNLKVTMVWVDPPANVGDNTALVNDLDLRLSGTEGVVLPWILESDPELLSNPAQRGVDRLNNVEQIALQECQGQYVVEVEAFKVQESQAFYVAYQYDTLNKFEWDFPTASDNMPYNGESGSYFRWSTTLEGFGVLQYSLDQGGSWHTLSDQVDLGLGYWRWSDPPNFNGGALARMVVSGGSFLTEEFAISRPIDYAVGFSCADSLMLKWGRSISAKEYDVKVLKDGVMQSFAVVEDTFLIIPDVSLMYDQRVSVQPRLPDLKSLISTPAFDYEVQGVGCYVFSFFQSVALDTGIYLNLQLGTAYGIREVVFERKHLYDFIEVGRQNVFTSDQIIFLDSDPVQGRNEYRARLIFNNEEQLVVYSGVSYYLTELPVLLSPNPVSSTGTLQLYTRPFDGVGVLSLYDGYGSKVLTEQVYGSPSFVSMVGLKPGLHLYQLQLDGEVFTGKILVK